MGWEAENGEKELSLITSKTSGFFIATHKQSGPPPRSRVRP